MTAPAPPAPRWGRFLSSTVFLRNPQYLWKTIEWLLPEEGFHYAQIYRPLGSPRGDPFRFQRSEAEIEIKKKEATTHKAALALNVHCVGDRIIKRLKCREQASFNYFGEGAKISAVLGPAH
jgi:hypothetical protein